MPRRGDKDGPQLPSLVVTRKDAAEQISVQIDRGREILSRRISSSPELKQAEADKSKWFAYTRELLLRLFDSSVFADEFRGSGVAFAMVGPTSLESEIRELRRDADRDVTKLESILRRLDLVPEHPSVARGRTFGDVFPEQDRGSLAGLHPEVRAVAERLFLDGHYAQAIFEAFKAIAARVKANSPDLDLEGKRLMARVFKPDNPILKLNQLSSTSEKDEQEGFMHIFMGAMQGIRNPKAHDVVLQEDRQRASEYLALASPPMRRIDDALLISQN